MLLDEIRDELKSMFSSDVAIAVFAVLGVVVGAALLTLVIDYLALDKDAEGNSRLDYVLGVDEENSQIKTNYSVQQAHMVCSNFLKREIGASLLTINFDPLSSRYNSRTQEYKVFYDVTVKGSDKTTERSWAFCDVDANTATLKDYRIRSDSFNLLGF